MSTPTDVDTAETGEWIDALNAVWQHRGPERANFLVNTVVTEARRDGLFVPHALTTAYKNTIPPQLEEKSTGNREIDHGSAR